jgi:hypothetical protein
VQPRPPWRRVAGAHRRPGAMRFMIDFMIGFIDTRAGAIIDTRP